MLVSFILSIHLAWVLLDYMMVLFFSFLSNLQIVLRSGFTNLHSHQHCMKISLFFSISSPAFVIICLLDSIHFNQDEIISHCSLICIYLMISDTEHLFIEPFIICIFSFDKCLFRFFAHFKIRL